jgi:uncharacterized delta-60 repeat protein
MNPRCLVFLSVFAQHAVTYAAPGDLDPVDFRLSAGGYVLAAAVQPDGKFIVAGEFITPRGNIARFSASGGLDTTFDPRPNGKLNCIAVQSDGKILLGGSFTEIQPNGAGSPVLRNRIARLNPDGTVDMSFDPNAGDSVTCMALQADGKILVGGRFRTLQPNGAGAPVDRNRFARLNPDGSLDTGFTTTLSNTTGLTVYCVLALPGGKVLLGGHFDWFKETRANGESVFYYQRNLAKLNGDGTLDRVFDPEPEGTVICMAMQDDGKLLLGGDFTRVAGAMTPSTQTSSPRNHIARLNANGTLDTGFDPNANSLIHTLSVQGDGRLLIAGSFTSLRPNNTSASVVRNRIARLNPTGTLDQGFDPYPDGIVSCLTIQADGRVLTGGHFSALQPNGAPVAAMRTGFVRLQNDPATQWLSATNPARVSWTRGGSSPFISGVAFELSTDNGINWIPLGEGTRMGTTPHWELAGLALPASGRLRARGVTAGGYTGSSPGLTQATASFPPFIADADNDGLLDSWELTHWPTTTGHGPLDDFDRDGYNELLELALGLNPTAPDPGGLPPVMDEDGYLTMTITKQPGVTYEVQSADTLLPGMPGSFSAETTTLLTNDATKLKVRDNVIVGTAGSRLLRVK